MGVILVLSLRTCSQKVCAEKWLQNCQDLAVCLSGHKTATMWQFVSTKKSVDKTVNVASFDSYFKLLHSGRNRLNCYIVAEIVKCYDPLSLI